jgi:hypothetical protein
MDRTDTGRTNSYKKLMKTQVARKVSPAAIAVALFCAVALFEPAATTTVTEAAVSDLRYNNQAGIAELKGNSRPTTKTNGTSHGTAERRSGVDTESQRAD